MSRINELITILRDRNTSMIPFKQTSDELATLIAKEVKEIIKGEKVILVPILRAGMAFLPAFMKIFEKARVGFVGIHRDEKAKPHLYYEKLPPLSANEHIIILDPMVATGGSTLVTLQKLTNHGADPAKISIASMIGAPEGKAAILEHFPNVHLHLAILDEKLDDKKYIVPGLGDFGDRFFGTT